MKIAFLSYYSGRVNRGVETYVHELSNRLNKNELEVTVYQSGKQKGNKNYNTVVLDKFTEPPQIRIFTNEVLQIIEPDTDVIIPLNGRWQSVLCKIWSVKNNKNMIISGQSGPGIDDRLNLYTFPNVFVSLTSFQSKWARSINPLIKFSTIPNGVDLDKFNINNRPAEPGLPRPIILSVGALEANKRHHLSIEAVSRLKTGSLLIIGKGSLENELRSLGKEKLQERFALISANHDELPEIYRSADLFVFPTVSWESFGIVLLEAMASGLGVVANDDPIRREIVGEAGLFVNPENTLAYTQALEKALQVNWGNKPREQAEKFSWDKIADQYSELFKSL